MKLKMAVQVLSQFATAKATYRRERRGVAIILVKCWDARHLCGGANMYLLCCLQPVREIPS